MTPELSILIVCYNSRELIEECLRGVFAYTVNCDFEVLLVDCSNDGTRELVTKKFPGVRVIENAANLGYGGGNNFLAERALGQFLLLLNPDTVIKDNAIGELYRTAKAMPNAGAVGGRARLLNGSRDPGCRQFIPTLFRLAISAGGGARLLNGALPEKATEAGEVETLSGAFMIVRADAWRQAEGFDTSFFMYSEELDLCVRLRQLGWQIVMTPRAEIVHLVGGGSGASPQRVELLTTGRMHFFRKFWSPTAAILAGIILWCHGLVRILLATIGGAFIGSRRALSLRRAYHDIVFRPQVWWHGFDRNWHERRRV